MRRKSDPSPHPPGGTRAVKTLAELQAQCADLGLSVPTNARSRKDDYIAALRDYHWRKDHPDEPLPAQIRPMLLGSWEDLDEEQAEQIEGEGSGWIVQEKLDGVRVLLHIEEGRVRVTSRCISEVTFRLSELQDNLPHLTTGLEKLIGTVLDGELVCPVAEIDTGTSVTAHPLQAVVAIISTSPENARGIQERHNAHLRLHVFDVLRFLGEDVTGLPLLERIDFTHRAIAVADNAHLETVMTHAIGKSAVHRRIIEAGGEGTVWKRLDQPYEPGRRVKHWLKRKRTIEVEAFVSGFKSGTPERGHAHLVGALEFSVRDHDGAIRPIAWVSAWREDLRQAMTQRHATGKVLLDPSFFGRRAIIVGQDFSTKAKRVRHAKVGRWLQ